MEVKHVAILLLLLMGTAGGSQIAVGAEEAAPPTREQLDYFENHIRPVLATRCLSCHGAHKQESNLRVDSIEGLRRGGDSGPAIVAGQPDDSYLLEAIRYESVEMPPDGQLDDRTIAHFEKWIAMGAPWPQAHGASAKLRPMAKAITDAERAWWAFQPVRRPQVPESPDDDWSRNAIDRFILRRLRSAGLQPAPEADRRTLIRRVTFDLTGLPPTPEEIDRFLADPSPDAYEKLVDELLQRPQHGEHMASYWLDLVRYAESDGFRGDKYRGHAWRYRDYVIKSFNADKPYTQFVREQLAGDEIAPGDPDALNATMFLRHGVFEENQRDGEGQLRELLADITNVTGDVFLGMGMGCARCHDHKFDPILHTDYFRLQAFFRGLSFDPGPMATREVRREHERRRQAWKAATADIRRKLWAIEQPVLAKQGNDFRDLRKLPKETQELVLRFPDDRTTHEQQIVDLAKRQFTRDYSKLPEQMPEDLKPEWNALRAELAKYDHMKPKALPVAAFTARDIGTTAGPAHIPGHADEPLEPGFPAVLGLPDPVIPTPDPLFPTTGRRTVLADWITSPDNPLSTRVIANRLWMFHFGRGLAANSSDFGKLGSPPTHPELLDWLTREFVDNGWTMKRMHRLIVTSATYRQQSNIDPSETALEVDPLNELHWRRDVRRLQAEAVRDALLRVSGQLDLKTGGASVGPESSRRSVYLKVRRNSPVEFLSLFDFPDRISSTAGRTVTTTPMQALLLANSDWALSRAEAAARHIERQPLNELPELIDATYRGLLARKPTAAERTKAAAFLRQQSELALVAKEQQPDPPIAQGVEFSEPAQLIRAPKQTTTPSEDFTVEAVVVLRSVFPDASVRTIASQWDSNTRKPGWSFGVSCATSKYKSRNLVLQLVGTTKDGNVKYEVVASDLFLEFNRPYYVAMSVKIADSSSQGVTFYVKDLSDPNAKLQTAQVEHAVIGQYFSERDFIIGGRDQGGHSHHWDGWISDLRLTLQALPGERLLIHDEPADEELAVHWDRDALAALRSGRPLTDPPRDLLVPHAALVDLCHALLSSNEFLYID